MMIASMHSLRHRRISIGSRIKNEKYVNNLCVNKQNLINMRLKTKKPLINLKEVDIIGVKKD